MNKREAKQWSDMNIPTDIDRALWDGYLEHRRELKAPMTEYALKGQLGVLMKFKRQGYDPNVVVREVIEHTRWISMAYWKPGQFEAGPRKTTLRVVPDNYQAADGGSW